jgi:hypothetical protein
MPHHQRTTSGGAAFLFCRERFDQVALHFFMKRKRLFLGGLEPGCSGPLFVQADAGAVHKLNGFYVTEPDALRVAVTQITLDDLSFNWIEAHGAEGAHGNTGATADADIVIHFNPVHFVIAGNGADRTADHTGSILTLLAGHGNVKSFHIPFDHANPAAHGIDDAIMFEYTHLFAGSAARAFFVIYFQYFGIIVHDPLSFRIDHSR